jgi:hypothetical protein
MVAFLVFLGTVAVHLKEYESAENEREARRQWHERIERLFPADE